MNTKFIQILIPLVTVISCREYDEVASIENTTEKVKILEKMSSSDGYVLGNNSLIAKDSTLSTIALEKDPPVKHGGHWRMNK